MKLSRKPKAQTSRRQPNFLNANDQPTKTPTYYSKRLDQETNVGRQIPRRQNVKPQENLLQFWLQRSGLAVLLVVCFVSVIYALNLSNNGRLIILNPTNNSLLRSQTTYQTAVDTILAKSIWNDNKITIDTAAISQQLINQFPELSSVNVVLPLLAHRPVVYLTPAQPSLIIVGGNGTFVLDINGKALRAVTDSRTLASFKLPTLIDQSGLKLTINQRVLSSTDISFIQTVMAQLAAKKLVVTGLRLPVASREIDVNIAGQPYFVKFNLQNGDARLQSGSFLATQAHLASQGITPTQYIDVRVPGRAYYQ